MNGFIVCLKFYFLFGELSNVPLSLAPLQFHDTSLNFMKQNCRWKLGTDPGENL